MYVCMGSTRGRHAHMGEGLFISLRSSTCSLSVFILQIVCHVQIAKSFLGSPPVTNRMSVRMHTWLLWGACFLATSYHLVAPHRYFTPSIRSFTRCSPTETSHAHTASTAAQHTVEGLGQHHHVIMGSCVSRLYVHSCGWPPPEGEDCAHGVFHWIARESSRRKAPLVPVFMRWHLDHLHNLAK